MMRGIFLEKKSITWEKKRHTYEVQRPTSKPIWRKYLQKLFSPDFYFLTVRVCSHVLGYTLTTQRPLFSWRLTLNVLQQFFIVRFVYMYICSRDCKRILREGYRVKKGGRVESFFSLVSLTFWKAEENLLPFSCLKLIPHLNKMFSTPHYPSNFHTVPRR